MKDEYRQAVSLLAEILKCDVSELHESTSMQDTPKWDSFAHVELMMTLAERFGVEMTETTMEKYMSVEGISTLFKQ